MTRSEKISDRSAFAFMHQRGLLPWMLLIFAALSTLVIAACGSQSSAPSSSTPTTSAQQSYPSVTIKAMDFTFDQPQSVPAGFVDVSFVNNGQQPHMLQIARVNNGNYNDFQAAMLKEGDVASIKLGTFYGGVNTLSPGQKQEVILKLQQGEYASICFYAGQDNVPHYKKGMINHFTVTASQGNQSEPQANADISLKDFTFVVPSNMPAGPAILKVTNQGPQTHEIDLTKLHDGKNAADLKNWLSSTNPNGPPPADFAGGMGALAPGSSGWLKTSLQPGNYAVLCFVPDAKTGKPHFMLGMVSQFTVA